jgi:nitrogen regulatory protein PII
VPRPKQSRSHTLCARGAWIASPSARNDGEVSAGKIITLKERDRLGGNDRTITATKAFDEHTSHVEVYRSENYIEKFPPKLHIEMIVAEDLVSSVLSALQNAARSCNCRDSWGFVFPVEEAIRLDAG